MGPRGWHSQAYSKAVGKEMDQNLWWSGYKKTHAMKFQGVVTPDGLVSSLFGPVVGKTGDFKLWDISGLSARVKALMEHLPPRERLLLYGDAAYKAGGFGIAGAKTAPPNGELSPELARFNKIMSTFRIAVEHGFGLASNLWQ